MVISISINHPIPLNTTLQPYKSDALITLLSSDLAATQFIRTTYAPLFKPS